MASTRHPVIVFDLDGTLSDPLEGIGRSINHALRAHGHAEHALAALAQFIGPPLDESFVELTGSTDARHVAALVASYRERYREIGYAENTLYDGIAPLLVELRAAGATLGLCTSKLSEFAEMILARFGLREHFAFVSGGEIGVHKWQQLEALRASGQVDAHAVMVGDRAVDITAAHRNGLHACGVRWGFGSLDELQAERPRYLVSTPRELAQALLPAA